MLTNLINALVFLISFNVLADSKPRNLESCFVQSQAEISPAAPQRICMNDVGLFNDGDHEWVVINAKEELFQGHYDLEFFGEKTYAVKITETKNDPMVCGSASTKKMMLELPKEYKNELSVKLLKVTFVIETLKDSCHSDPYIEDVEYKLEN